MTRSPAASSLPEGALPSPISAMRPSTQATHPCLITRSARTILALPIKISDLVAAISNRLSSCGGGERCYVDDTVRDAPADLVVMNDCDHGDARTLLLVDQLDHDLAVGGIQRCRRL